MKKLISTLLLMLMIGVPVTVASEVEELSQSEDYVQIQSLVPKIEDFSSVEGNDAPIANIEKAVKVYPNIDIFSKEQLTDDEVYKVLNDAPYYWIVPLENTLTTVQADINIVQPYDRKSLEENVRKGLTTEKEKEELIAQEGKWDISSIAVFEDKNPFVLDYTFDFLKQNHIQYDKVWFMQPNYYFAHPMALIQVDEDSYNILVYDDIHNIDGNGETVLKKNHLYTFEEAKQAMETLEKDRIASLSDGNTGPGTVQQKTSSVLFISVLALISGMGYYFLKEKKKSSEQMR